MTSSSSLTLGNFQIYGLRDGYFSLDGGAMFGVVPKIIWDKIYSADDRNRIRLGLNSLLIQTGHTNVLIETGMGTFFDRKFSELYVLELEPGLVENLKTLGVNRDDIDLVINTHLHFDHCGGNTMLDSSKQVVPTYPNAQYIIQRGEWEAACRPTPRDKSSYLESYFRPVETFKQLRLVEGDTQISEGIDVLLAPGHTAFHQCVKIQSEGQTLLFLGDMVPTSGHVRLPYIMSYDLFPVVTMENKEKFYNMAIEGNWIVAFNHDPDVFFGKIEKRDRRYHLCTL